MTLTLLLDLDDTLLNTNTEAFIPAYFQALAKHLAPRVSPERMLSALMASTRLMMENADPSRTLQDVFEADFYPRLGVPKSDLSESIEYFYDEIFPTLRAVTSPIPAAAPFIEWAFAQGYRIAIATNPLFPRKATHHRVRWAGFDPNQFEIVSTFDDFHFSKNNPAYYAEVLGRMGWNDGPVLMVGDDLKRDIRPAQIMGLTAYLIENDSSPELWAGARGNLIDLQKWLETTDLSALNPSFKTVESILGVLSASPASLLGLCSPLDSSLWRREPSKDDWALIEIICHLRDTEREIHHTQLKLLTEQEEPFIPRPDTAVWANQRDYLHEDGRSALMDFARARMETLSMLKSFSADDWSRGARHAIFGPTNFLEVVGFIAEHDRLHIQQAWKTIHAKTS